MLLAKVRNYYVRAYKLGHFPNFINTIFSKRKKYLYVGFLGDGNYGDELVYEAAKEILDQDILIPYQRHMPFGFKIYCQFFWRNISGCIIGGGTLIGSKPHNSDFLLKLLKYRIPFFIHGTGVNNKLDIEYWNSFFENIVYGGVRGPISLRNLNKKNSNMHYIGDAAFSLFCNKVTLTKKQNTKKILINFGSHLIYDKIDRSRFEIEQFAKHCILKGYYVEFLPYHSIDIILGNELKMRLPEINVLPIPNNYSEVFSLFNDCEFAIGERLHFSITALLCNCCFLSINYDEKHYDFLESINIGFAGIGIECTNFENIELFFNTKDELFNWEEINNNLNLYKTKQLSQIKMFVEI